MRLLSLSRVLVSNCNVEVLLDTVQVLPVHQRTVGRLVVDELAGEGDGPVLVPVYWQSPRPSYRTTSTGVMRPAPHSPALN